MSESKLSSFQEQEREVFFASSFDLMAVVGTDGYFKRINPAVERALGYSETELLSQPLSSFLHPDDVLKTKQGIRALGEGKDRLGSVNRYRCKDGTYKWFSWNTKPMGELLYSVGRDITEQVKADERIRQLNRELELKNVNLEEKIRERVAELQKSEAQLQQLQKMDAIGRLAGGIAHDFNNMLAVVSLYCDLLLDTPDDPKIVRDHVENIAAVTRRAAELTKQLLLFSRKQLVQHQPLNLNPLIMHLENMLGRLIGENIEIVTKLSPNLKTISADPGQIEQVIMNLAVNARDAMPDGGRLTIETGNIYLDDDFSSTHLAVTKGHYALLAVSDTGAGMDAATLARIFEPFFTTKPAGRGTGIGLATTYGIVKQCKGTIWVYSEPGQGTVFKIYLPVLEQPAVHPEFTLPKSTTPAHGQTVLLTEDDPALRTGFTLMLERKGYKVLVAANGDEALSVCRTHSGKIDLLLTDMVMPGMSGLELAQKIRALRTEIRTLFMSGYTDNTLESVEDPSAIAFIQKPFGSIALVAKVEDVLSN